MIVNIRKIFKRPRRTDTLAYELVDGIVDAVRATERETDALQSLLDGRGDRLGDVQRTLIRAELSLLSSRRDVLMLRFKDLGGKLEPTIDVVQYESDDERRKVEGD